MTFANITEVKRANKAIGQFWFSPDTLAAFKSRVESLVIGGRFWVESSCDYDEALPRRFQIARADDDGDVSYLRPPDYGPVYGFGTKAAALAFLADYVAKTQETEVES